MFVVSMHLEILQWAPGRFVTCSTFTSLRCLSAPQSTNSSIWFNFDQSSSALRCRLDLCLSRFGTTLLSPEFNSITLRVRFSVASVASRCHFKLRRIHCKLTPRSRQLQSEFSLISLRLDFASGRGPSNSSVNFLSINFGVTSSLQRSPLD